MKIDNTLTDAERRAIANAKARDRRRTERNREIDAFLAGVREEFPELAQAMDAETTVPLGRLKWTPEIDHDRPEARARD